MLFAVMKALKISNHCRKLCNDFITETLLTMTDHIFTGFGFGPIQGGLFVKEAFDSGNFKWIVISEIDQKLVDAVRADGGSYYVNVAKSDGIEALKIDNVEKPIIVVIDTTADFVDEGQIGIYEDIWQKYGIEDEKPTDDKEDKDDKKDKE